ncbi:MAG: alpha-galactosidase [Chloroflexi bacterium AL-W]|nr:alpha-galactosidase [Chloroflexi bacterium AL-N1]NOK65355.1 alpha-galactosidase [Chloroflexi bacterium AL-N10]NOK72379.1 alpha-galactosidase [Chloroflexi bacterium AL-N5]NOK79534.1 alpha-galactosidase [Chloroflexi bacterium AL-W]NOK87450.1 alpha-galactosidase [Chloroflexi bacterium AL-N15]
MGPSYLPLSFRFHVSMCGTLGVGGHLLQWTPDQHAEAAQWIALYKEIRHIIQFGDLYRPRSPQEQVFSAVQYVSKDRSESILLAFRTHLPEPAPVSPLYLRGLDPNAMYMVEGVTGERSGLGWMHTGLFIELQDFQSTVRRV